MIDGRTLPNGEPIFTHVDHEGVNTHIHAESIRKWCIATNREALFSPVDYALAKTFVRDNSVSKRRMLELAARMLQGKQFEPIIYCKDGTFTNGRPDVFLVDGHHRFALYAAYKKPLILSWVLEVEEWQQFKVINLPDLTKDELRNIPIAQRNY